MLTDKHLSVKFLFSFEKIILTELENKNAKGFKANKI